MESKCLTYTNPKHTREQVIERLKVYIIKESSLSFSNNNKNDTLKTKDQEKNLFRDRFTRFDDDENDDDNDDDHENDDDDDDDNDNYDDDNDDNDDNAVNA